MTVQTKKIYLDLPEVAQILSLGETTVQKMVTKNEFPAPRMLTSRRVGWLMREVEEWAENRPVSNLPPPANTGVRKATSPEIHNEHQEA